MIVNKLGEIEPDAYSQSEVVSSSNKAAQGRGPSPSSAAPYGNFIPLIGSVCSIFSLMVSLFVAFKVIKISQTFSSMNKIKGDQNVFVGRDADVR